MRSFCLIAPVVALALVACLCASSPAHAQSGSLSAGEDVEVDALVTPVLEPWLGDLDGMRRRRMIRILVPYSKTHYFVDGGRQYGIAYEYGVELERALNRKFKTRKLRIQAVFLPTARDEILSRLIEGKGDIAMAALTVTPERERLVDFSDPIIANVNEIVVLGRNAPETATIEDLSGREVAVRESSSYFTHLLALNERLRSAGRPEMRLVPVDEDLEDEDLLEMANAGLLDHVVVDHYKAALWGRVFGGLKIRNDLAVNSGGNIAWAVRKGSPMLRRELNAFAKVHRVGTTFGNMLMKRYTSESRFLRNATSEVELQRYAKIFGFFETHAADYRFNPLMIVAQGFQESGLDQSARSPRGAVGIMQLLPATAADPAVGVSDIEASAERNIQAGMKYLRWLISSYLDDAAIDEKNQALLAFAAYNAGPGNVRKMRRLAQESGLDPNKWFQNVEIAAARLVGNETVEYVGNIYKYYIAYRHAQERTDSRLRSLPNR